jgi:hypothetical protein
MAPTILDFWRSDVRRPPGKRAPRWIGWVAFTLGFFAMLTLFIGAVTANDLLVDISLGLSLTAGFVALVALIAGVGRVAGFFGLLFALAGNVFVIGWLGQLFT